MKPRAEEQMLKGIETESLGKLSPAERAIRIINEVGSLWAQYGISSKSKEFVLQIKERAPLTLSVKQEAWMKDIEERTFSEDDPTDEDDPHFDEDMSEGRYRK